MNVKKNKECSGIQQLPINIKQHNISNVCNYIIKHTLNIINQTGEVQRISDNDTAFYTQNVSLSFS